MKKADAPAVADLIRSLTKNIPDSNGLVSFLESLCQSTCCHCLVAECDGNVVAHGALVVLTKPSKGLHGRIEEVVVDERYKNHGIASSLMEKLEKLAKSLELSQVELETSNPVAEHIYEKQGFKKKAGTVVMIKRFFTV